jgi:hypothetical protein
MALGKDEKECPYCAEVIKAKAVKCRYCQSMLDANPPAAEDEPVWDEQSLQAARDRLMAEGERLRGEALGAAAGAVGTQGMLAAAGKVEEISQQVQAVSEAMQRTTDGTYGRCAACGNGIGLAYLHLHPTAQTCEICSDTGRPARAVKPASKQAALAKKTASAKKAPGKGATTTPSSASARASKAGRTSPPAKRSRTPVSNEATQVSERITCSFCSALVDATVLPDGRRMRAQHDRTSGLVCVGSGGTFASPATSELGKTPPSTRPVPTSGTGRELPGPDVPLNKWRGLKYMSRGDVSCACNPCGNRYTVPPEIANTLAQEQGLGARLQRWGIRTQHMGNQMTPGFGQLAMTGSGLEMDRQNRALGGIMGLVACPRCGSSDILLGKAR